MIALFLLLVACKPATERRLQSDYFDLKDYFVKEASRLQHNNPVVSKAVVVNGSKEEKEMKIMDWENELSVFSDADINKAAWQGLFKMQKNEHQEIYYSEDEKVPVKKVIINRSEAQINSILIVIKTTNTLYTSSDTLSYFPDSLYEIKKMQQIRLMGPKKYKISGTIK